MTDLNNSAAGLSALHFGIAEACGTTVTLNAKLFEWLRRVADSNRRDLRELVEEALTSHLRDIEADNWARRTYIP